MWCLTFSEVVADWHELMVTKCSMHGNVFHNCVSTIIGKVFSETQHTYTLSKARYMLPVVHTTRRVPTIFWYWNSSTFQDAWEPCTSVHGLWTVAVWTAREHGCPKLRLCSWATGHGPWTRVSKLHLCSRATGNGPWTRVIFAGCWSPVYPARPANTSFLTPEFTGRVHGPLTRPVHTGSV